MMPFRKSGPTGALSPRANEPAESSQPVVRPVHGLPCDIDGSVVSHTEATGTAEVLAIVDQMLQAPDLGSSGLFLTSCIPLACHAPSSPTRKIGDSKTNCLWWLNTISRELAWRGPPSKCFEAPSYSRNLQPSSRPRWSGICLCSSRLFLTAAIWATSQVRKKSRRDDATSQKKSPSRDARGTGTLVGRGNTVPKTEIK